MALQSEVSPPMVGDPNTVKQIGETKSEENDMDDEGSQSTDEEVDLEDGEIPDSEEEEKDFTHSSLKEALDESCLQDIEKLVNKAKQAKIIGTSNHAKMASPRRVNKTPANYMDHDRNEGSDQDDGWAGKYKPKFDSKPVDYRDELNEFRGTPPSSPERKHDSKSRRKSSKKSKKSRRSISRKDVKGMRAKYIKEAAKGRICKFFKDGKCNKGADCMFSHPAPFRKKELCKFYLNGHCNKGRDCIYMHHEFPCKFYHTGVECYAKDKCRFSHAPLNDEMKRVLADYLRMTHGDDRDDDRGRDRKRRLSPEPKPPVAPPKRKCLLGSPPRHIKEAEETKQWQEEMKKLGSQNIPGFEIHLEEDYGNMTPPHFQKPNFYNETLNTPSPHKRQGNLEDLNPHHGNSQSEYEEESEGSKLYVYDDDEFIEITVPPIKKEPPQEYHWKDAQSSEDYSKPYAENARPDCDFSSDIKFDETTQFSEMESSVDCPPPLSPELPNNRSCASYESRDSDTSNLDTVKIEDASGESNQEPPAPSIQVPSHLPRKQQELLMRVLQHQRLNAAAAEQAGSPLAGENFDFKKEESEEEVVVKPAEEENDSKWYSSEDDDDDSDQPLTDVLKKIQQAPPPKPQVQGNKPSVNILDMFNKIQQKTMESKGFSKSSPPQKATDFWANILQGTKPKAAPIAPPSSSSTDPKRRTLLPDPAQSLKKTEASATIEPAVIKDPRLKNRDPRKRTANLPMNSPKLSPDRSSAQESSPSIQDSNPLFSKPLGSVTGEPTKENIPYKLRSISAAPPNYTPYLSASQSNPNLLKDPRLRRHLRTSVDEPQRNGKEHQEVVKPTTPKDVPPMPELLRKYTKPVTAINIFESSSSSKRSTGNDTETKPSVPVKVFDPRMQRRDSRSNSNSSCDTPPHLTIVDTFMTPLQESKTAPVLESALEDSKTEKKWTAPVPEKSWAPVPLKDWKMAALKVEDIKKEPGVTESEELVNKKDPVTADIKKEPDVPEIKKEPGDTNEKDPVVSVVTKESKSSLSEKREFSLGSFSEKSELGDLVIKEEPMTDSENSLDPSRLELGSDSSHKKSPSPLLNEEFITVIKEEATQDSNNDSHPVVPPLIIKKVKPTVASHLPRAIADPRMAKLHTRVEPRRPRALGSDAKSSVDAKKQALKADGDSKSVAVSEPKIPDVPKAEVKNDKETPEKTKAGKPVKEAKGKLSKSIPKKRRLSDKGEEKKKPAHRNRKSSMDYASPLNSCDSTNSGKSLDYNNYNQRPKRTVAEKAKIDTALPKFSSSDTSIPDFVLSDNSNLECDNSNDVNLKDRFKTIDPTASPFC